MPTTKTNQTVLIDSDSWRMYEILIGELKHLHVVWTDNFRVILTFNSILLPATFGVFAFVIRNGMTIGTTTLEIPVWSIFILSGIGVFTTIVMMLIIRRIKAFTILRQQEVRKLEQSMMGKLFVYPFLEGYVLGGGSPKGFEKVTSSVKKIRWSWFDSHIGYALISIGFVIAYLILGAVAVFLWVK